MLLKIFIKIDHAYVIFTEFNELQNNLKYLNLNFRGFTVSLMGRNGRLLRAEFLVYQLVAWVKYSCN